MPDYAMCVNSSCPRRYECARYMMIPSSFQSYMGRDPDTCESFWDVKDCGYPLISVEGMEKIEVARREA